MDRQIENPDEDCYSASGYQSTTESLASPVFNYIYENGSSFSRSCSVSPCPLLTRPCRTPVPQLFRGEQESHAHGREGTEPVVVVAVVVMVLSADSTSLDMHHQIFIHTLEGRLDLALIDRPQRILDVGTGTGIWAIDMADTYPSAEVIGTDIKHFLQP